MLENIQSLILIAGCQRSGTTLCGQMLGAHPNCILLDEPDGLYPWFEQTVDGKLNEGHALQKLLNRANQKYKPDCKRTNGSGVAVSLKPDIKHLVLKAPNLTYDYQRLATLDLPLSVIFPVRDPRAVVASMQGLDFIVEMDRRQVGWVQKFPAVAERYKDLLERMEHETAQHVRLALVWLLKTGLFEAFQNAGLDPLVVRYEDLVSDPETYRRLMFTHAGLTASEEDARHEDVFQGRGPGLTERSRPVDAVSLDKWRDRLTEAQASDIMREAGELGTKFNYRTKIISTDKTVSELRNFDAPLVLLGRGGSGTRLLSEIAQSQDVFLGNRVNKSGDSVEWVDTIYEIGARRTMPSRGHDMDSAKATDLLRGKAQTILNQDALNSDQDWGWKLPETMLIVPDVLRAFPKARFIHLVRHPVTSSLRRTHMTSRPDNPIGLSVLTAAYRAAGLEVGRIHTDPEYLRNAYTWLYQVGAVHKYAADHIKSERYLLVKYEDLLSDPEAVSRDISAFIHPNSVSTIPPDIQSTRSAYHQSDDPRILEVWRICEDVAVNLGYMNADQY